MKKDVKKFIREHKHINYCEAIIDKNGLVEYAEPSHLMTLCKEYGKSKEEIDKEMSITASPLEWLVEKTGCVAIWWNYCVIPKSLNEVQKEVIKELIKSEIVGFDFE